MISLFLALLAMGVPAGACHPQQVSVCYPDRCGQIEVTVCPSKAFGIFISGDEAIVSDTWGENAD